MSTMNNGAEAGNFVTLADLQASKPRVDTFLSLTIDGRLFKYRVELVDAGKGLPVNGMFANLIHSGRTRTPVSDIVTVEEGFDYMATANSTITMPDVTGFVGGEQFTIKAALAATLSTLTVEGSQGEEITPRNGGPDDTVFNLMTIGVIFEFTFNIVTGNWEV